MQEDELGYEICLSRASSNRSTVSMVKLTSCTSATQDEMHKRINHKLLSLSEVFREIESMANNISEKTELDQDVVFILLHNNRWDQQKSVQNFFNAENSQYYELKRLKNIGLAPVVRGRCAICQQVDELLSSYCGHSCCRACWSSHIHSFVHNLKGFIRCINHQCGILLLHSFIVEQHLEQKQYIRCISLEYVNSTKSLRFCPGVDCEYCFQDTSQISKNVVCRCGTRFCFRCAGQPHEPCSCDEAAKWFLLTKNEMSNELWIKQNTKLCPSCKCFIERAFGCNFIACTCGNNFCYFCGGKWDEAHISHYECPIKAKVQKKPLLIAAEDQAAKITKQYESFLLHGTIQKRTSQQLKNINQLREEIYRKMHVSEGETLFLQTVFEKHLDARAIIKWAQIFQFFHSHEQPAELREFALVELKGEVERCGYELSHFVRRVRLLVGSDRHHLLDYANPSLKEFHAQRESILKIVNQTDIYVRRLLQQIDK